MEEIFVLWQPVLINVSQGRRKLTCFLTELSVGLIPVDSVALPESLLDRLNIKGDVVRWQTQPCLTAYTTPPEDLNAESSRWRRAWIVDIEIETASTTELVLKHESFFLKDGRIGTVRMSKVETEIVYLVVADFANGEDRSAYLNFVRGFLPIHTLEVMMATLFGVNLNIFQVRLRVKAKYFESIPRIEQGCYEHGGFANFTQRIDIAEEIYHPAGID